MSKRAGASIQAAKPLQARAAAARLNIDIADLPDLGRRWTKADVLRLRRQRPQWLTAARRRHAVEQQRRAEQRSDELAALLDGGGFTRRDNGSEQLIPYADDAYLYLLMVKGVPDAEAQRGGGAVAIGGGLRVRRRRVRVSLMRQIADPVVAAAPAGARIRTRIHPTAEEAAALRAIGALLGSVYHAELAGRVRLGRLDHQAHAAWRAQRKRALTAVSSSRWAGAITRAVADQYRLGMRSLAAHVADLRAAVEVLEQRCALRAGDVVAPADGDDADRGDQPSRRRGYRSAAERFAKTRRLAVLRERLAAAQRALAAGRPSITMGDKRLWRTRNHLDAAGMTEQQWRERWDAARMFLTADGESGKAGGNETIRVDDAGQLRIKTPVALVSQFGSHVVIDAPIRFAHRGGEWRARVAAGRAVR